MPATPRTILAPLPNDPRIMALAKSVGLPRREAFAVAAEAWAWMAAVEVGGLVKKTPPDSLDGLVDVEGFGTAMLQVGLVGVVDDSLVLPAELRRLERDQCDGRVAADGGDHEDHELRRKALNAESARRYRRKKRMTGSASKSAAAKPRSLGRVAGHEVRVFDGQYGPYAMLLGATLGGASYKKLTTGDKTWSVDTVTLADALPGLLQKWQTIHEREQKVSDRSKRKILDPPFAALQAEAARHADASSRHADASALASSSSDGGAARKPASGNGLDAPNASSSRHADALSSMSSISSLSLSSPEEKREREEREESEIKERRRKLGLRRRMRFDELCRAALNRWTVTQFVAGEEKKLWDPDAIAADLGLPRDEVLTIGQHECWNRFRRQNLEDIESAGDDMPARAHREATDARAAIDMTTEPAEQDKPATGIVEADERDDPDESDHDSLSPEGDVRILPVALR